MVDQRNTCIFTDKYSGCDCSALDAYYCNYKECNFYKSKDEYEMDDGGFVYRKDKADGTRETI